jgi:methyltransferase (TIGR00027 family)
VYVAAGRAIGAREPDPSVRNPDSVVERLLGDVSSLDIDHPAIHALPLAYEEAMQDVEVANIVRAMMVRTRFIDDALARAVAAGVTQVAILGAGFDTHAYRCQELLAGTRVFEIDRPVMQAFKKQRVNEVLGAPPDNLTYIAIDFKNEGLADVLPRHGYDLAQPTFFILEGVTMYLPEAAVRQTLQFVAAHPPGSTVVFDYLLRPMIDMIAAIDLAKVPPAAKAFVQRFVNLTRDEPWIFGFPVNGERDILRSVGLELQQSFMIGGEESVKLYLTRADGSVVGAETIAAAMAKMAENARLEANAALRMSPEQMREQQRRMAYQIAEAAVSAASRVTT